MDEDHKAFDPSVTPLHVQIQLEESTQELLHRCAVEHGMAPEQLVAGIVDYVTYEAAIWGAGPLFDDTFWKHVRALVDGEWI